MKKVSLFLLFFCLGVVVNGFSQATPPTDFFAGKWEIMIAGTPRGDVTFRTDLIRKDGKLTGELVDAADPNEKRPITKVEESADKLVLHFNSEQAGELAIDLTKVDDDNLKGQLMNFDTKAKRIK